MRHFSRGAGICLLLLLVLPRFSPLAAQKIRVDNISYEVKDSYIEIRYDLLGIPYKEYKISVELKREQAAGFSFKPKLLSGDVGKGTLAGEGKKIIWDYTNEFKPEAGVTDYYFEVTAKRGSKTWLYVAGGGILVAGGVTAALLLTGNKDKSPPATAKTFPVPVRPSSK